MRRYLSVVTVLLLAGLIACGGGGGGSSALPYTGLSTPAVITTANADNIARQAFQGGDLGANATLAPARAGDVRAAAGKPMALTLVRILSGTAAAALPTSSSTRAPEPRAVVTESGVIDDGWGEGGQARYTLSVDNVTGVFTGTFVFDNFHGDGGGIINGTVAVSGVVYSGGYLEIHFDFRSVTVVDGTEVVTADGTVDLTGVFTAFGTSMGTATLNLYLTDSGTGKTVWLKDYMVNVTDLGGATEVRIFGYIYLHDYGYVYVHTEAPFLYPALSTQPTSGAITLTGSSNCRARLTVVDAATYTVDLDADGNGSYEWSVTHTW